MGDGSRKEKSKGNVIMFHTSSQQCRTGSHTPTMLPLVVALLFLLLIFLSTLEYLKRFIVQDKPKRSTSELHRTVQQLTIPTSFYLVLFQECWAQSLDNVVRSKEVIRDASELRAKIEDLPETFLTFRFKDFDYLIRQEYLVAYEGILAITATGIHPASTNSSSSNISMANIQYLLLEIKDHDKKCIHNARLIGGIDVNGQSGIGQSTFYPGLRLNLQGLL